MVVVHVLIAEVFLVPPTAPPTCSARGGFVCAAVPPLDNGGPGLLTMAPTSEPTYYTVALWDRFPETETRAFGSAPVSRMREMAGKETKEGDGKGGGAQVSLREDGGHYGLRKFQFS